MHQGDRSGIGHAILLTRHIVGDDEIFVVLGDTICEYDVKRLAMPCSARVCKTGG